MDQLADHCWSHFCYSPLLTRGSAGRVQLVTLLLLSTHHPWISRKVQLVTLLLLFTYHPWISWQSTAGHTSVTLHSSLVDQLEKYSWSHFCYSPLITRGSTGRAQLVTLLLLSSHHPWISWQITAGHSSVTLHSSPVNQLAEHSWSHFCYSPVITRWSAGKAQMVTVLLLYSHHPSFSWQSTLVTLHLLSTQHPCVSCQRTAGHTSVTLHSSPLDKPAKHSWSHFCYTPLITRGSAGRSQLVILLLLSSHHPCVSWQSTLVTLLLLSTHHPWINWQSTAGHTSVTLQSSPVGQLAKHSWSHFCYSPLITRGSAGKAQLVTLLLHSTHHPWISWQITAGHTSVTLHSSPVDQLAEYSWSHFCYSPLITRRSAGRVQLVTLLLLSTHHPWISWQSTLVTLLLLSSHHRVSAGRAHWSHFYYSPLITRGSAGRVQLVTLLLLSTHNPWISWQSTYGHTSVTLHASPVDQLAKHSLSDCCYSQLITRGSAGRVKLVKLLLLSTHHQWVSWQNTAGHTSVSLYSSPVGQLAEHTGHISITSTAGHTSVTLHSSPVDQLAEYS